MSTRYVWEKWNTDTELYDTTHNVPSNQLSDYNGDRIPDTSPLYYAIYDYRTSYGTYIELVGIESSGSLEAGDTITILFNDYIVFSTSPISGNTLNVHRCYSGNVNGGPVEIVAGRYPSSSHYGFSEYIWSSVPDQETVTIKGSTSFGPVSGTSQSSYPTDGAQGSYWYTYQGSDSIDPTAVGYNKTTPKGGESITINVTPKSNTYGGTITYKYEVQLSGGTWTNIGSTTSTAKSYVIPKGTTTFRARVVASDNMGFTSTDYVTGNTVSVINNTAPSISGEDSDLGTFRYEYPTISYIITDSDEQTVIRKIELDSVIVTAEEAIILGQEYTYTVTEEQMDALADGVHTIKITATDSEGASAVRQYTFTKFFGSDTLYQRLRRLNDLGLYDTIYFENMASNIIRPNGMTVQETIDKIEADLAELEK